MRGVLAFDRLMAEEAAHRAETADRPRRTPVSASVVVLDYGSGNIRSAVRALEHVGADVTLTADPEAALAADGLFVPGRGQLPRLHGRPRAPPTDRGSSTCASPAGGPVLGVCVGMQVMFEGSTEPSEAPVAGVGEWPGTVSRLLAPVVPHMGWSTVEVAGAARCSSTASSEERFYFVHSYAAHDWALAPPTGRSPPSRRWSPGPPTASGSSRPSRTARSRRPSSTPRSPARPALALLRNWVRSL